MAEGAVANEERGNWSGKLDFFLSAVGYAVGLGNVWKFPYLAYENGGASFLFPYIVMLIIAGLPLFFIELAIGQFTAEGPITCWRMAPAFMGIGYAMVIISGVVSIYYNMIIAYAIYYMMVAFVNLDGEVPWAECQGDWSTEMCRTSLPQLGKNESENMEILYGMLYHKDCVYNMFSMSTYGDYDVNLNSSTKYVNFMDTFMTQFGFTEDNITEWDATLTANEINDHKGFKDCMMKYTTPPEEYFKRHVLNQEDNENLTDIGDINLKLILSLLAAWILIFACLIKGIKSSGKVVYFTATFPYIILIVMLIRGVTLDGHLDGIEFYVIPKWDKLADIKVWNAAATQIFYSLGVGFGGLLTMASYNKFKNNCYRDSVMVACINCGTSIFAGFAIFSLLGHMAQVANKEVEDVAEAGFGLAFVAYPDGISRLPASPIWAFLFFFMILTLGMDSQFAMMETVISAISDLFPNVLRKNKTTFTFIVCTIGFLLGIPLTTEGGGRVLSLMVDYSGTYNLMIIAIAEIVCLCYIYGIKNFRKDIEMMIGTRANHFWIYWYATWLFISPAAVIFIVIVSAINYVPSSYERTMIEDWAEAIGWLMILTPIAAIVVVLIYQMIRIGIVKAFKPQYNWGPAMPEDQVGRYAHMNTSSYDLDDSEKSSPPSYDGEYEVKKDGGLDNPALIVERF